MIVSKKFKSVLKQKMPLKCVNMHILTCLTNVNLCCISEPFNYFGIIGNSLSVSKSVNLHGTTLPPSDLFGKIMI